MAEEKRCEKCGRQSWKSWQNDHKKALVQELIAVVGSYGRSRDAEDYMNKEGRACGLLQALYGLDHQGHLPDPKELKDMESVIRLRMKNHMTDWLLSHESINSFLYETPLVCPKCKEDVVLTTIEDGNYCEKCQIYISDGGQII